MEFYVLHSDIHGQTDVMTEGHTQRKDELNINVYTETETSNKSPYQHELQAVLSSKVTFRIVLRTGLFGCTTPP